jgi:hypothetical protein
LIDEEYLSREEKDIFVMSVDQDDAPRAVELSGNFRSSPPIVAHANLLYSRTPSMEAVGRAKNYTYASFLALVCQLVKKAQQYKTAEIPATPARQRSSGLCVALIVWVATCVFRRLPGRCASC